MGHKIGVLHAVIAVGADGDEGLVAFRTAAGEWMPLIASGEERLAAIRRLAMQIGAMQPQLMVIRRFEAGETIETLDFRPAVKA